MTVMMIKKSLKKRFAFITLFHSSIPSSMTMMSCSSATFIPIRSMTWRILLTACSMNRVRDNQGSQLIPRQS